MPPARNHDLHGNVPDESDVALLLIDVINDLEFQGGERLLPAALAAADRLATLAGRARRAGVPVIYANDNFGRWRSDFSALLARVLGHDARGRPIAERLRPEPSDYVVLKPKHSGFFATPLETVLAYLGAKTVILTGVTGDICVLLTAADAFLRDLRLLVPSDCVAAQSPEEHDHALAQMEALLKADTRPCTELDLEELKKESRV